MILLQDSSDDHGILMIVDALHGSYVYASINKDKERKEKGEEKTILLISFLQN